MTTAPVILLVEDNEDDAELTILAFKRAHIGNSVVHVRDGVDAMDWLLRRGPHDGRPVGDPAVILLDLKLPKKSGIEVLREIRSDERLKRLPVVILTSSDHERDRLSAYESFANSYIKKPVDHEQFVAAARDLGLYWLVLNVPPTSPKV